MRFALVLLSSPSGCAENKSWCLAFENLDRNSWVISVLRKTSLFVSGAGIVGLVDEGIESGANWHCVYFFTNCFL